MDREDVMVFDGWTGDVAAKSAGYLRYLDVRRLSRDAGAKSRQTS